MSKRLSSSQTKNSTRKAITIKHRRKPTVEGTGSQLSITRLTRAKRESKSSATGKKGVRFGYWEGSTLHLTKQISTECCLSSRLSIRTFSDGTTRYPSRTL